jgi:hypothetical protein
VLLEFIVFTVVLNIVLVRFLKLTDLQWKRVDYVWLTSALLGVLAASSQVSHYVAKSYSENVGSAVASTYVEMRLSLQKAGLYGATGVLVFDLIVITSAPVIGWVGSKFLGPVALKPLSAA